MSLITVGQEAPDFTAPTDTGALLTLSSLRGRPVILYFYPTDDTPGCTTEACGFRDAFPAFEGATVLGVSKDSVKRHASFKAKYGLPFTLVSDESAGICEAYGAFGEKTLYGKKYMGIHRVTVLIGADGIVKATWPKVDVKSHAATVSGALAAL